MNKNINVETKEIIQIEVQAYYGNTSVWTLDFDIKTVFEWYIKWNTLYVKHTETSDYQEFEPDLSAEGADWKRPDQVFFDGVEQKC